MCNKDYYTLKEFISKYEENDLGIRIEDFFKHIDRYTSENSSNMDFFRFFNISKSLIKADNGHNYRIPYESAPLLAAMIRVFQSCYGYDKRMNESFSYEEYHEYISNFKNEIEKLDVYQKELIKNYYSYHNAMIIDEFMPDFLDRITLFIYVLFAYKNDIDASYIIHANYAIEQLIDDVVLRRRRQEQKEVLNNHLSGDFTFENAVGEIFKFLCDENCIPPKVDTIFPDLTERIAKARKDKDRGNLNNKELTNYLNEETNNFYSQYPNPYNNTMDDIFREKKMADNFWDSRHLMEIFYDSKTIEYKEELKQLLNYIKKREWLFFDFNELVEHLEECVNDSFKRKSWPYVAEYSQVMHLLECYENEVTVFLAAYPLEPDDEDRFIKECCEDFENQMDLEKKFQGERNSELSKESCRDINYYQTTKDAPVFKSIKKDMDKVIGKLLPVKLK